MSAHASTEAFRSRRVSKTRQTERLGVSVPESEFSPRNQEGPLLRAIYPNMLVVGSEAEVVDTLHDLRRNCRQPIATCEAGSFLALPAPSQPGALILRNVENLGQEGQQRLMEWLENNGQERVQVIATSAAALWPQVKEGAFTEALYYRLNVIYIDLTNGADNRSHQTLQSSLPLAKRD